MPLERPQGVPLFEGDTLQHPDGMRAIVTFDPTHEGTGQWRAVYADGESLYLGNQISSKGQTCKVLPGIEVRAASPTPGGRVRPKMTFTAPATVDPQRLKGSLGFTSKQTVELAGVASDQHWRRYTGGAAPRAMSPLTSPSTLPHRPVLTQDPLRAVGEKRKRIGPDVDIEALARNPAGAT